MKSHSPSNFVLAVFITLIGLGQGRAATETVTTAEWKARMQRMLSDVQTLLPFAFLDQKNFSTVDPAAIATALKSLSKNSGDLKTHTLRFKEKPGAKIDPSFPFIANTFQNEVTFANSNFALGIEGYQRAQVYLRSAVSACVMCHTQSPTGPSLSLDRFKTQFATLSNGDRILALAATRQFDEALNQFDLLARGAKVIKPDAANFDINTRAAMAIAVRVKQDPVRGLKLVGEISESGAGSPVLRANLPDWKRDFERWTLEKRDADVSDQALFNQALRLQQAAEKSEDQLTAYHNFDVPLLRASALLHDLLANHPGSALRPQSYLILAKIYGSLPGYAIWDLSDQYLFACMQENPHSEIGETCLTQYDKNVFAGYTGTAGTNIPAAVKEHMLAMRELATRKKEVLKIN